MFTSLRRLYSELSKSDKRKLGYITLIIILAAILQVVGIASIFPFISAASDPSIVDRNQYLANLKQFIGVNDNRHMLVVLGSIVLVSMVLTNLFLAYSTWINLRFVVATNHNFSYRLLRRYLQENYLFHLRRNSAELLKNITTETPRVVNGGIMSAINVISKGFAALCILAFLIFMDPVVALVIGAALGFSYALVYFIIRRRLARNGVEITHLFSERSRHINESLGGIKELKVLGNEGYYLERFRQVCNRIVRLQVFNRASAELPKYILETIAFGSLLVMTIYLIAVRDNVENVLPMISLYAFAGYRLMPAIQGIFASTANLKHDLSAVDLFYEDLTGADEELRTSFFSEQNSESKLALKKDICLQRISFTYPGSSKSAISQLSLDIKAYSSVGIIGASGGGKSTLTDILLGLLRPNEGSFLVDNVLLDTRNVHRWQRNLGYVPQDIFLADATVMENIAFGLPLETIDFSAVEKAAKLANLHDFVVTELENGYRTVIGEDGLRLSGGQRQRVGIARALYNDPDVLILDEATSALDTRTEQVVMEGVYGLAHKKTIVMIAHRISTVRDCDQIVWMEGGAIKAHGSFDSLFEASEDFRKFVHLA